MRPLTKQRAEECYALFLTGLRNMEIAKQLGISESSVSRMLSTEYNVKARGGPYKKKEPKICSNCGGPPTHRDEGKLTRVVRDECVLWLCSKDGCLTPSIEDEMKELREHALEHSHGQSALGFAPSIMDSGHIKNRTQFTDELIDSMKKKKIRYSREGLAFGGDI